MERAFARNRVWVWMLVWLGCPCLAAVAGDGVPDLVTDRPDQTESSVTVDPRYIQFEFGWTHAEDNENGDVTTDSAPETLVRIGLVDDLELRLGFAGYVWQEVDGPGAASWDDEGATDIEVGFKVKLRHEQGWTPETALLAGTTLPTGQTGFSSERFDPAVRLACSHTLSETFGLGYNLAAAWETEEDAAGDRDTTAAIAYSVVLGAALSDRLGTFVEFFGEAPTGDGKPANSLDGGFTWLLADNVQLDVLAGLGISEDADDWFIGAGLVWRLPR